MGRGNVKYQSHGPLNVERKYKRREERRDCPTDTLNWLHFGPPMDASKPKEDMDQRWTRRWGVNYNKSAVQGVYPDRGYVEKAEKPMKRKNFSNKRMYRATTRQTKMNKKRGRQLQPQGIRLGHDNGAKPPPRKSRSQKAMCDHTMPN